MKKYLNTLFVTTQGAYLAKEGETVAVRVEKKVQLRLPIHTLAGIVCFGNVGCSPFLMGFCAERDVSISFLTEHGRFLARVLGPVSGNVLLRREQYRRADDPVFSALMARAFVRGKIANSRVLLNRSLRDHGEKMDSKAVARATNHLTGLLKSLSKEMPLAEIRGTEGDGAHVYFRAFDHLIIHNKEDFFFHRRSRRPPLDLVNCLLSFIYTLIMHDVRSALESTGLDPAVGFLHRARPGHPSLALDMMEEFRPLADRLALTLINRGQLQANNFDISEGGGVWMKDKGRKTLLTAYQERKQNVLLHPFLKEKMPLGLFFHTQALLLARFLRGDLDGYPPMIQR